MWRWRHANPGMRCNGGLRLDRSIPIADVLLLTSQLTIAEGLTTLQLVFEMGM